MKASGEPTTAGPRAAVCLLCGVVVAAMVAVIAPWQVAALAGWSALALVFVAWIWATVWSLSGAETARLATREDGSRPAAELMLVSAAVASLIGVALGLVKAAHAHGPGKAVLIAMCVLTVVLSWASVHTVFTLRYAHLYYGAPPGGIDFNEPDHDPDYQDFAYLAFTIGMTFQVSDTDITAHPIRNAILRHALLSYLFGAVIVAMMINVVAGFLNK